MRATLRSCLIAVFLLAGWAVYAAPAPAANAAVPIGSWLLGSPPALTVPSAAGLNLRKGFTIEARLRPGDLRDGRNIVCKDKEYALRIDWPSEGGRISFYVYADGKWEPRVSACCPQTNQWYHVVAAWDGYRSFLWVDGEPFTVGREAPAPPATDNPVLIGAPAPLGTAFVGEIEYVRIYARMLPMPDIIGHAYGIESAAVAPGEDRTEFDFSRGLAGWKGQGTASARAGAQGMTVTGQSTRGYILRQGLDAAIGKKDFLNLRLAVDRGTRADLVFITTLGAGRMHFDIVADGKPHSYVLEPWTWAGWGGHLLALGVAPSEADAWTASVSSLRLTEAVSAEAELGLTELYSRATLPRAGRTEVITARLRNAGGTASNLVATLTAPPEVEIAGVNARGVGPLGFQDAADMKWTLQASKPGNFPFVLFSFQVFYSQYSQIQD